MSASGVWFGVLVATSMFVHSAARAEVPDEARASYAQAVYSASPEWVHDRRPQPLLRAVVVLRNRLDEAGAWRTEIMRGNEQQPEMVHRAIQSAQRVHPETLPVAVREKLMRDGVIETWLFDNDGRFQVRTLAKAQQ